MLLFWNLDTILPPSSFAYITADDLLVVGLWTGGIGFIDVSDPENAILIKEYSNP